MIISLGECDIDISAVCIVKKSISIFNNNKNLEFYTIKFDNGHSMDIYENGDDTLESNHMPREQFIKLWAVARQKAHRK